MAGRRGPARFGCARWLSDADTRVHQSLGDLVLGQWPFGWRTGDCIGSKVS